MQLKPSKFNLYISTEDNNQLVFNTFSDSRVVVDHDTLNLIKTCSKNKVFDNKQTELLIQLKDLGIVLDSKVDEDREIEYWFQKLKFDTTSINATILTTLACNMKCIYCFEQNINSNVSMDLTTAKKVIGWLLNKIRTIRPKELIITFFGGEPLLNLEVLKYISKELYRETKKERVSLSINIITNGLLITEGLVNLLKPYGLKSIKITLDGNETTHDKMRPHKNGSGTYKKILSNILKIKDKINISIGGNYDESSKNSIPLLLEELKNKGLNDHIKEIAFKPVLKPPDQKKTSSYLFEACTFSDTNVDDFFWLLEETEKRGFKAFKKFALGPCEALREQTYTFGPKGNIYKCAALAGREEFIIGRVEDKTGNAKNVEFMTSDIWRKCKDCIFVPLCNGGCRISSILKNNSIDEIACEKDYFNKVLKKLLINEI